MEDAFRVRLHLPSAPGSGAALCQELRASSRRSHRPTGQPKRQERTQNWIKLGGNVKLIAATACAAAFIGFAYAQEATTRTELKRGDLTGTNMEVVVSILEVKPGETIPRHTHHGEEAFYTLEGATIELPDGKQIPLATGFSGINVRDVPHAGFKVVSDKALKLLNVHVVDKGKPFSEPAK
jgi:quercetin dioxygenase-like cupin family protein